MTLYPEIGANIWVGNFQACDDKHAEFDRVIHLWHPYQKGSGICSRTNGRFPDVLSPRGFGVERTETDLFICYEDQAPLDEIQSAVWEFVHGTDDRLLIHCAAGLCRSPTISLLALVARGTPPVKAVESLYSAMWAGCRLAPHMHHKNVQEVFAIAEAGQC